MLIYNILLVSVIQQTDSITHGCMLSHVQLIATQWTVACQSPLPVGFSRQEYGSGLPFPSPGDLPDPGIEPSSPSWQVDSLPLSHLESPVIGLILK